MPNQVPPWLEERVIAFALGHPGLRPRRIAVQLRPPMWGGLVISPSGVYNILGGHGLRTAGCGSRWWRAMPPRRSRSRSRSRSRRHGSLPAIWRPNVPGELVQLDWFHIGRLTGTKGRVWQPTAIDVASFFTWAEIHVTPLNPAARHTSALVRRVAAELAAAGWRLQAVSTDSDSEFRSQEFRRAVATTGAHHRFIHAGRPRSNGCVERVQRTILEECWRPSFARSLVPKVTALQRDLVEYLDTAGFDSRDCRGC
jgi:transposase InsO family protein